MKVTKILSVIGVSVMIAAPAFAGQYGSQACGFKKELCLEKAKECSWKKGPGQRGEEAGCPIANKFFKKYEFIKANQVELEVSDKQMQELKQLKLEFKKTMVQTKAQHEILMLSLEQEMYQDKVDVKAAAKLIDDSLKDFSAGMKTSIELYAKLKETLNAKQWEKAKEIWRAQASRY